MAMFSSARKPAPTSSAVTAPGPNTQIRSFVTRLQAARAKASSGATTAAGTATPDPLKPLTPPSPPDAQLARSEAGHYAYGAALKQRKRAMGGPLTARSNTIAPGAKLQPKVLLGY